MLASTNPTGPKLLIALEVSGPSLYFIAKDQTEEQILRRLAAELKPILDRYRETQR